MLTLALPKGRLADESIDLLLKKKWVSEKPDPASKELRFSDPAGKINILFVRSQDVPTYVEEYAADVGFIGWDILCEGNYDLLVPLDLRIGKCRLSLAGNKNFDLTKKI